MLKNYTTKVPAAQSANEIQMMLVKRGAQGVLFEYEQGTGRIAALSFKILINGNPIGFKLPNDWRAVGKVLVRDGIRRAHSDEDYVYRVSWRILRDWVDAQMALLDVQMVVLEQVFLPYAITKDGKTVYETLAKDPSRLLGSGN